MSLRLELIDHTAPSWPVELAALWRELGAPNNAELPPDYFVQTTFVKMGGRALRILEGDELRGVGLLFPRGLEGGKRAYTLRVSLRRQEAGGRRQGPDSENQQLCAQCVSALEDMARLLPPTS